MLRADPLSARPIRAQVGTITTSEQSALFRHRNNAGRGASSTRPSRHRRRCQSAAQGAAGATPAEFSVQRSTGDRTPSTCPRDSERQVYKSAWETAIEPAFKVQRHAGIAFRGAGIGRVLRTGGKKNNILLGTARRRHGQRRRRAAGTPSGRHPRPVDDAVRQLGVMPRRALGVTMRVDGTFWLSVTTVRSAREPGGERCRMTTSCELTILMPCLDEAETIQVLYREGPGYSARAASTARSSSPTT